MKKLLLLTFVLALLAGCNKEETPALKPNHDPEPEESTLVSGIAMPVGGICVVR